VVGHFNLAVGGPSRLSFSNVACAGGDAARRIPDLDYGVGDTGLERTRKAVTLPAPPFARAASPRRARSEPLTRWPARY